MLTAMGAALGICGAIAIAGFGKFLKDNFTGSGGGGGGGGGGGSGDPDYTLRVYWKDLKQRPFATKAGGLMAIDGDLLVSSARRLRSVIPGAFNYDVETTSREVNDAEANQLTFIDVDEKKFYGRRFYATEDNTTVSVLTGQGVGFGESETDAKNNIIFSKDCCLRMATLRGCSRKMASRTGTRAGYSRRCFGGMGTVRRLKTTTSTRRTTSHRTWMTQARA